MKSKILPEIVDNTFPGTKVALWVFYLITTMTLIRSCIHMFYYDGGAQSIATIPLDTFTKSGAEALIFIFTYWGLSQFMFGLLYVIVSMKYRSLIPLMYLSLILEWGGRFALSFYKSIETVGQAPGGVGNYVLPVLCVIMFFLSIRNFKP